MKNIIEHPVYGQIFYDESFWTGKKKISIGGTELQKVKKNIYSWFNGEKYEQVTLSGNMLLGVVLTIRGEKVWVLSKPAWYDWILSILPLMLMIWGNSLELCLIIPVVGGVLYGAVGGGIGGALAGLGIVTNVYLMRKKNVAVKILLSLLITLVTFGIGALLGYMILFSILSGNL